MTFILIVSIMVNMVAILAIINLYLRQNRLIQLEKDYKEYTKEIEDLINTFIIEMKEENDEIKQLFMAGNGSEPPAEEEGKLHEVAETDRNVTLVPKGYLQNTALNAYGNANRQSHAAIVEEEAEVIPKTNQNRILTEALNMKNQGSTIEEIAKNLGRGKTEIELLLKLSQK